MVIEVYDQAYYHSRKSPKILSHPSRNHRPREQNKLTVLGIEFREDCSLKALRKKFAMLYTKRVEKAVIDFGIWKAAGAIKLLKMFPAFCDTGNVYREKTFQIAGAGEQDLTSTTNAGN